MALYTACSSYVSLVGWMDGRDVSFYLHEQIFIHVSVKFLGKWSDFGKLLAARWVLWRVENVYVLTDVEKNSESFTGDETFTAAFLLIWSVYSHQVSANLLISIIKQIPLCTFGRNIILVPQVESHYEYYIQGSFGFYISVHIASLLSVVQSSAAAMTEFSSGDR